MIIDHFSKTNPSGDPIEFLVNFLTRCGNLSDSTTKKQIALECIEATRKSFIEQREQLEKELEAL